MVSVTKTHKRQIFDVCYEKLTECRCLTSVMRNSQHARDKEKKINVNKCMGSKQCIERIKCK